MHDSVKSVLEIPLQEEVVAMKSQLARQFSKNITFCITDEINSSFNTRHF